MKSRFRLVKMSSLAISLAMFLCLPAFAQYGGGTGGTGGTSANGTYTPPSGGYKSSTGIAIGAAAAAGVGLAYLLLRKTSMVGCVTRSADRLEITNEKNQMIYALEGDSQDLVADHRFRVSGKKINSDGKEAFRVKSFKDLGNCPQTQARASSVTAP